MGESMRRNPDGSWSPAIPLPEAFGVTWERMWRARRRGGQGQGLLRSLICGWLDARALRRLTGDG